MQQKNITGFGKEYSIKKHADIKDVQIIEGKNNFPISWLNQQGYCEYQIYLEYMKGIETAPTHAMTHGSEIHHQLEDIFKQDATPATFEEVVETSKSEAIMSRECFVISPKYGDVDSLEQDLSLCDRAVSVSHDGREQCALP